MASFLKHRKHELEEPVAPIELDNVSHEDADTDSKTTEKDLAGLDGKEKTQEVVDAVELEAAKRLATKQADLNNEAHDGEFTDEDYKVDGAHDIVTKILSTRDDPELKILTFRMFFLGLGLSAFGAVLAQLYYFKPQTLSVSTSFLLIISYFIGKGWEKVVPRWGPVGRFFNPGEFNIKEHAAILIMCSTASASATAIQVISVQELYYGHEMNGAIAIFTLFSSQLIGYGFAGFLQEALVYPTATYWPTIITSASMFQALHFDGGLSTKRVRVFWGVFIAIFLWEIIPEYAFPLLAGWSIACLVNHTNPIVRNVFGGGSNNEGMGILAWSFDWNYIGSACLYTPLWTQLNMDIGYCLCWILMPTLYYGNVYNGLSYPFMSQAIFDGEGNEYNQTALLTNGKFDAEKYAVLGPAHYAATNVLVLVAQNLAMGAITVHVFLYFWSDIQPFWMSLNPFNKTKRLVYDEHYAQMEKYKKVPKWAFAGILLIAFAIAQATNYTGHSDLPWWALIVVLLISLFFTSVYATTDALLGFSYFSAGLDGLYQMITAYMVRGDPVANMYGTLYGAQPTTQGLALLKDLKLGQYLKIPPRVNFIVQILGCLVGAILNWVMMNSIIAQQRPALLSLSGTRLWSGQNAQSYNSNAIAWGALSEHMFCSTCEYRIVPISLAIGCFLPIPLYIAHRLRPTWGLNKFNTGIIVQYSCEWTVGLNCVGFPIMFLNAYSQFYLRRYKPKFFTKYNYLIAGALDGGTQVIVFILNLAVFGAVGNSHPMPSWWGNDLTKSADRCLATD